MSPAPPADAFPAYPASWYLFGESRELSQGPVSRRLLGRRLVAFRTASGRLVVMDGECAHLGADLGGGEVVGETIRCPFHHWRYGCDGACVAVAGGGRVPPFARLRAYPVEERHGSVFFFNGREALFPLPFFAGEDPADYAAARAFRFVADCPWYMTSAHAFDRQHFAAVHDRELTAPPAIDCPAPYARRNRYPARVVGRTALDRLLRWTAGDSVETTLTIWGGTFSVITARFDRAKSGFLVILEPREDGTTLCHGLVLAPRARGPQRLLAPLALHLRRLLTLGYLEEETRRLRSARYKPASLGPADQDLIDFFHWAAALPQESDHEEDTDLSPAPAVTPFPVAPGAPSPIRRGATAGLAPGL